MQSWCSRRCAIGCFRCTEAHYSRPSARPVPFPEHGSSSTLRLYFDARALVSVGSKNGPEFELLRGVRQGCPASPSFFNVALTFISWSYRLTFEGIQLISHHLATLEYADDQILFTFKANSLQDMLNYLLATAEPFGLRLSPKKCELYLLPSTWLN